LALGTWKVFDGMGDGFGNDSEMDEIFPKDSEM